MDKHSKPPRIHAIHLTTLLYMAWRNMFSKKLRSFLTLSGIVIGIGAVAFLISFGLGLQQIVTKDVIGDQSIKSIAITSPNSRVIKLNTSSVNSIRTFPHVTQVGVEYSFPASIGLKGGGIDSVIYGYDANYQEMSNLNLIKGRLLKKSDNRQIVISKSALSAIGASDPAKALNQSLSVLVPLQNSNAKASEIKDDFKIVGVVDSGNNNEVYVPSAVFDVAGVPAYTEVKVITDDTDNVATLRKQIEGHGFLTNSPIDTLGQINQLFKFFNIMLAGFGGIGILVAVLGMFNTLTISLLERTKEIGLMLTLGARGKDMRRLFKLEASLLSLFGVAIGIIFAVIGGKIVDIVVNVKNAQRVNQRFELFSMPLWLIGSLTLFMLLVGLGVAFFPARRAQKISPIDALRRE